MVYSQYSYFKDVKMNIINIQYTIIKEYNITNF